MTHYIQLFLFILGTISLVMGVTYILNIKNYVKLTVAQIRAKRHFKIEYEYKWAIVYLSAGFVLYYICYNLQLLIDSW